MPEKSSKNRVKGLWLTFGGLAFVFLPLLLYPVLNMTFSVLAEESTVVLTILNAVLAFMPFLGLFVLIPSGIYFLSKK